MRTLLVLAAAAVLAGCGGGDSTGEQSTRSVTTSGAVPGVARACPEGAPDCDDTPVAPGPTEPAQDDVMSIEVCTGDGTACVTYDAIGDGAQAVPQGPCGWTTQPEYEVPRCEDVVMGGADCNAATEDYAPPPRSSRDLEDVLARCASRD